VRRTALARDGVPERPNDRDGLSPNTIHVNEVADAPAPKVRTVRAVFEATDFK